MQAAQKELQARASADQHLATTFGQLRAASASPGAPKLQVSLHGSPLCMHWVVLSLVKRNSPFMLLAPAEQLRGMMLGLHSESTTQDAEPDLPDMLSEGIGLSCDSLAAQELMHRRSSWLAGAQQQASELLQHLEGILQFEYARYERHHLQKASLAFFLSVCLSLLLPLSLSFCTAGVGKLDSLASHCSAHSSHRGSFDAAADKQVVSALCLLCRAQAKQAPTPADGCTMLGLAGMGTAGAWRGRRRMTSASWQSWACSSRLC